MPLSIHPKLPYDFALICSVFSAGDPAVRKYHGGILSQVVRVGETPVAIRVRDVGQDGEAVLAVDVLGTGGDTLVSEAELQECVTRLLNTGDDLDAFSRAVAGDPVLSRLTEALSGLRMISSETVFEAVVTSIIEQQIATPVARQVESRVVRRFGEEVRTAQGTFYAYPRPEDFADASPRDLRECGLSFRKAGYILEIARAAREGEIDLEAYRGPNDPGVVIDELCRIRGIGRWTAEFVLLRGLHRLDVIPAGDLGIRRAIARFYSLGDLITPGQAREFARRWGDWKGLAAYYLLFADQHAGRAGPSGRPLAGKRGD
ncbi:MAG: DNA-3-methyladenine glycosylase [Methanolinea sp.]|nr:DNA-3-methyladenine glycosylase [Methanolinea sp.]